MKRFRGILVALMLVEALGCVVFIVSRRPIDADGWAFLEKQRPNFGQPPAGSEVSFTVVADGLSFVLFRRPIGGWESRSVHLFLLFNFVPYLIAFISFGSPDVSLTQFKNELGSRNHRFLPHSGRTICAGGLALQHPATVVPRAAV